MKNRSTIACVVTVLFACGMTAGCGKTSDPPSGGTAAVQSSSGSPAAALPAAIKLAETTLAKTAPATAPDGNTLRLQGTMEVDAGKGKLLMRSMATVVDPKLGEKTAARLGTAEGQKTLGNANNSVLGNGSKPVVSGSDIQEMANSMAGSTVYSSQAMHVEMINAYNVTLDAKSDLKPGPRTQLSLTLSEKDLKLTAASLEFHPDGSASFERYKKKLQPDAVTIDKIERKDENTFVVSGSFKATELAASPTSKILKGQTLASVSGQFDFQEVPIRSMAAMMTNLSGAKK